MASKLYVGSVDIVIGMSKGKKVVKAVKSVNGKYNNDNVKDGTTPADAVNRMQEVSKERKVPIHTYSLYTPEIAKGKKVVTLILANPYGQPYFATIEDKQQGGGRKLEVVS